MFGKVLAWIHGGVLLAELEGWGLDLTQPNLQPKSLIDLRNTLSLGS